MCTVGVNHTHTHNRFTALLSRYQKGKTNLDLLEQEIVSGSGICWAICKSAPHPRQPRQHPTSQFFTGQMPFLPPNQQRQSTEGISTEGIENQLNLVIFGRDVAESVLSCTVLLSHLSSLKSLHYLWKC